MIDHLEDSSSFIVAGHRGFKSAYPENTLLSFRKALELGVDMLEFDLRLSKDKAVMIMHDETLDRTTNGSGRIGDFTLAELKQLDAGGWFGKEFEGLKIPTLEELCECLAPYPNVLLNVEVKPSMDALVAADLGIDILTRYDLLQRCVFTSFDANVVAHIHDMYGLRTQGFLAESMLHFDSGTGGTYSKMWAASLSMKQLAPDTVRELRDRGLLVWCYCPDDEAQVRHALECGVTVMTCNNPEPALNIRRMH